VTHLRANLSVNTDRREAALLGSLRGFAAPAAGYLRRWAVLEEWFISVSGDEF